jgi:hypothetical protein
MTQDTRDKLTPTALEEAVERLRQFARPGYSDTTYVSDPEGDLTYGDPRTIINALPSQEAIKRVLEADENVVSCGCCDAELHELSKAISTLCVGGK